MTEADIIRRALGDEPQEGAALRILREHLGIPRREIDLTAQMLSEIERGKRRASRRAIDAYAACFGCAPSSLLALLEEVGASYV